MKYSSFCDQLILLSKISTRFIYVVTYFRISLPKGWIVFYLLSYVYIMLSFFCSSMSGHVGCFHRVGTVRSTTTSVDIVVTLEILMSIILDDYRVQLLSHLTALFFNFMNMLFCFFPVAVCLSILNNNVQMHHFGPHFHTSHLPTYLFHLLSIYVFSLSILATLFEGSYAAVQ